MRGPQNLLPAPNFACATTRNWCNLNFVIKYEKLFGGNIFDNLTFIPPISN